MAVWAVETSVMQPNDWVVKLTEAASVLDATGNHSYATEVREAAIALVRFPVEPVPAETLCSAADYEEVLADHRRLVRELDVLLNGEHGAAKQASLCDIVAQVTDRRWRLVRAECHPRATQADDPETVSVVGQLGKAVAARDAELQRVYGVASHWYEEVKRLREGIESHRRTILDIDGVGSTSDDALWAILKDFTTRGTGR